MSVSFYPADELPNYADDDGLYVNMANGRAREVLGILGVEPAEDLCGSIAAEDLLARIAVAYAADDAGSESIVFRGGTPDKPGATWHDCGRPAGYFAMRLGELRQLAEVAAARGVRVEWS